MTRRVAVVGAAASAAAFATRAGAQAAWPAQTVKIIVPYPAGGSTDVLARILAEKLKEKLGQPFVIENRPGAGGNIGIAAVTGSAPDGYTIGAATVGHFSINQYLYAKMPYDPEKDFIPVTMTWELPNVFVVAAQHCPAKTVAEFITWAKQKGNISFGSPGVGTSPHLSAALFATRNGLNGVHVPFRGAAQTIPAMLAGDVTYAIDNLASYISNIEAGSMRALAVTSEQRWPTLPDVPTMAQAGQPNFVVTSWAGWVVPAGTPRPIVERIAAAQKEIAADPDLQKRFQVAGARVLASTPEVISAHAAKERPMWQEMVKVSGAKAE
ncbi:MAG: tripartite tricarboxylate transporter substrate binding protein [Pseudolabrys sp.]|nr:tripartite tricarboxylate transporter substrate binding protein [Pseudolabrys sp.]MBV9954229.1 tripartite tricarboxylate transporter substrate binding protein [Pseudolabrys sp.]